MQKSLNNLNLKFVNHARRVIDSRVTKRDQPIALSTSKRQFKEIANDFSLSTLDVTTDTQRTFKRLSRGRFRSERLLEKCSQRVPLVLGLSVDVKNWCTKILTRRDLSNSPLLRAPGPVDNARILFPRYLFLPSFSFLSRYQYHQHTHKDGYADREKSTVIWQGFGFQNDWGEIGVSR